MLRNIWHRTIWGDDSIDPPLDEMGKVWAPIAYVIFIYLGIAAITLGVPAITQVWPAPLIAIYGYWQIGLALVALYGCIFHRHASIEVIGCILLGFQSLAYTLILIGLTFVAQDDSRGYVVGYAALGTIICYYRYREVNKKSKQQVLGAYLERRRKS